MCLLLVACSVDDTVDDAYRPPFLTASEDIAKAKSVLRGTWMFDRLEVTRTSDSLTYIATSCAATDISRFFGTIYFDNFSVVENYVFNRHEEVAGLHKSCSGSNFDLGKWTLRQKEGEEIYLSFRNSSRLFTFYASDITEGKIKLEESSTFSRSSGYRFHYWFTLVP